MKYCTNRRRGFALILVLITVIVAATMAVFFMAAAGAERRGVDLYARGNHVRQLAEMPVNRVMGLINAATKEGTAAAPVSWASQPGMVRTFGADGSLRNAYKLYSWDNPVAAGPGFDPSAAAELPPGSWRTDSAIFTDLNAPGKTSGNLTVYPIMDPRAEGLVDGFSINATATPGTTAGQPAPMPVKWLYVLEDGQLVPPTGSGDSANIAGATTANPIVGRIAFWTDDETCKVNINTASEGAYWDWPKAASRDEMQFAGNPPVKNEFSRTPGHPAMTSLSAVFPELRTGAAWSAVLRGELQKLNEFTPRLGWNEIGGSHKGGSAGGMYPITSYNQDFNPLIAGASPIPQGLVLESSHMYASPDDAWFGANATAADRPTNPAFDGKLNAEDLGKRLFFLTSSSRAPETTLFETPRISLWPVTWPKSNSAYRGYARYFKNGLNRIVPPGTASRQTGRPAASTVSPASPIDSNPWTTPAEKLLAFAATLNKDGSADRYYFQRQDPDSPTGDWDNILRNRQLTGYLRDLMEKPEPGFGASLSSKWGTATASWIALNAFDYIRSMVNQTTPDGPPAGAASNAGYLNNLSYSFTGAKAQVSDGATATYPYAEANAGVVTPLRVNFRGTTITTQGSFPALKEVALVFYATQRREPVLKAGGPAAPADAVAHYTRNPFNWNYLINPGAANGGLNAVPMNPGDPVYPTGAQTTQMRAVMMFNFQSQSPGVPQAPFFWIKVTGGSLSVNGTSLNLTGRAVRWDSTAENVPDLFKPFVRGVETAGTNVGDNTPKTFSNSANGPWVWQLASDPVAVSPDALTFAFAGGPVTVSIYAADPTNLAADTTGDAGKLIRSQVVDFSAWDGNLPVPVAPRWNLHSNSNISSTFKSGSASYSVTSPDSQPCPRFSASTFNTANATAGDPAETRETRWAFSEYVPGISSGANGTAPRSDADKYGNFNTTRTANTFIPYAYEGTGAATPNGSRDFENRVSNIYSKNAPTTRNGIRLFDSKGSDAVDSYTGQPDREGISLITPYDTVISMVVDPGGSGLGDLRLNAGGAVSFRRADQAFPSGTSPREVIRGVPDPSDASKPYFPRPTRQAQWHSLNTDISLATGYQSKPLTGTGAAIGLYGRGTGATGTRLGDRDSLTNFTLGYVGGAFGTSQTFPENGDWTSSPGNSPDGGFILRPDQDYQYLFEDTTSVTTLNTPYFFANDGNFAGADKSFFSPNRQVPSPVIFGSLPSSMTKGWQTLAFSPAPAAGNAHPGLASPPDHLLLDKFWTPVAEPYPISDQFSTGGKINLNYAMMPFPYIERKTGLHALMKSTWITAIPDTTAEKYKSHYFMRTDFAGTKTRFPIAMDETLKGFDAKFADGDIFRSASQLCEMHLVPEGETLASTSGGFWNSRKMTSDTAREEPYNHLYSRVTTKSNTFTVHWKVQILRKRPNSDPAVWNEGRDLVVSELRGASLIERFIQPNATNLPDYATETDPLPLSQFYSWRVVSENLFRP